MTIIDSLIQRVTSRLHDLRASFMLRLQRCFGERKVISRHRLGILLNDLFINELTYYIRSDHEHIVEEVISEFRKEEKE